MDYGVLIQQIRARNELQSVPHIEIYRASYSQWQRFTALESQREELSHQLALLEHETAEYVNKNDLPHAVDNFRKRLQGLQAYHSSAQDLNGPVPLTNLSRTIYDQRRLISHQNDELKLLKSELNASIERNVDLDAEMRKLGDDLKQLQLLSPSASTKAAK